MSESWYQRVAAETPLTQGDLVLNCPVISWGEGDYGSFASLYVHNRTEFVKSFAIQMSCDLLVLTQACDLEHSKIQNVVVCSLMSIEQLKTSWEKSQKEKGQNPTARAYKSFCEDIADGYIWNLAFLNSSDYAPVRVVDFREIYTVPRLFLEALLLQRGDERDRLLPPYREHISQAFARFFMRVGLPVQVDKFWLDH